MVPQQRRLGRDGRHDHGGSISGGNCDGTGSGGACTAHPDCAPSHLSRSDQPPRRRAAQRSRPAARRRGAWLPASGDVHRRHRRAGHLGQHRHEHRALGDDG